MICSSRIYAQTICEGQQVVPIETFNQCNYNSWKLVFEDNFDGNNLNLSTWELQAWAQGALYGNNGSNQEYNTLDNIEVSNGVLKIIAKEETVQRKAISWKPDNEILEDGLPNLRTYNYTSSNIWTKSKFSYGKFEARIKIPKGKGFWPAFWTFGGNPWNELDVFEFWNENDVFNHYDPSKLSKVHHMTAHYDFDNDGNTNKCETKYNGVDFSQDFHIFTLIWEKNKIEWYVDGQLKRTDYRYYTMLGQTTGCTINAWTQYIMNIIYPIDPMAIILNLAIQHGTDDHENNKSPDNSTPFPSQMEVDWVKYYKKEPCQDVIITDASQFPLDNQIFNVIVGENIVIDCNYIVQSGQQLDIVAQNSITLKPGFHAKAGNIFHARIDPSVCDSSLKNGIVDTTNSPIENVLKNTISVNESNLSDIKVYPNPNDGTFSIDFGHKDFRHYQIKVFDLKGGLVSSLNSLEKSFITLKMPDNTKGSFILYLLDIKNNDVISHKIIIQ
jgi:beta-glucanase (GH16 family)